MRLLTLTLFAMAVAVSTPALSATGSGPGNSGALGYTCKSGLYPNIPTCMCDGGRDSADCQEMKDDGVCDADKAGPVVDGITDIGGIQCDDTLCACTWDKREAPEFSRVPQTATQPSEVARSEANTRDHRSNSRKDTSAPQKAKTTESSRRTPGSDSKSGKIPAPSRLALSKVRRTSLTLNWIDNASQEYGVSVERGKPKRERGGINYRWKRVFNVEERVESRTKGTGRRRAQDDGLRANTKYCYRLRAYRGNSFSKYTPPVCTTTLR